MLGDMIYQQDAILAAVADHTRGVAQSDDIMLVVIRRQD
jgi:hypothetical protein